MNHSPGLELKLSSCFFIKVNSWHIHLPHGWGSWYHGCCSGRWWGHHHHGSQSPWWSSRAAASAKTSRDEYAAEWAATGREKPWDHADFNADIDGKVVHASGIIDCKNY